MSTTICLTSYVTGSTSISSLVDSDSCFIADIDNISKFVVTKLGAYSLSVELHPNHVWTNSIQSFVEYSSFVNLYNAKNNLSSFLGQPTGSLSGSEQKYIHPNLEHYKRTSAGSEIESGFGGDYNIYSGSIDLTSGQQDYDIQALLSGTIGSNRIQIVDIWHAAPFGAQRWYPANDYTTSIMVFGQGGSFTSDQAYYLLPIWQDVARTQQYKFSFKFRLSSYSYDLKNNKLRIYPVPEVGYKLWFTYRYLPSPISPDYGFEDPTVKGVSNLSNVPFATISYCGINSMAKTWIRKFATALSLLDLGLIRSKYGTVPIPGGDMSLNGEQLVTLAREEMENLKTELKELLEETMDYKLAERDAIKIENIAKVYKGSPLYVYRF